MEAAIAREREALRTEEQRPACRLCGHRDHWLEGHLAEEHALTLAAYQEAHPGAAVGSWGAVSGDNLNTVADFKRTPPDLDALTVDIAGMASRVNPDVPEDACLVLPRAYRVPQHGQLAADVRDAAISLALGRSTYVWGLPGSGKDALFHAWSALTRTPGLLFQVEPAADIRSWFFSHEFDKDGTTWREGDLLRALRDGYTTPRGRVVPYMILFTDLDRATKEQAESLRLVLDSIQGRVKGPNGTTHKVLPGTRIVVTANTPGGGDVRGRCISSNVIDASILDRFERVFEFHWMDWKDEEPVVREKFPALARRFPEAFAQVGKATEALRASIAREELLAEFSHRALCTWLGQAEDLLEAGVAKEGLLKRALRAYTDRLPDPETRMQAKRAIDPFITGGVLGA